MLIRGLKYNTRCLLPRLTAARPPSPPATTAKLGAAAIARMAKGSPVDASPLCGSLEICRKSLLDISRDGTSFRVTRILPRRVGSPPDRCEGAVHFGRMPLGIMRKQASI
jgi:hypothetical protein